MSGITPTLLETECDSRLWSSQAKESSALWSQQDWEMNGENLFSLRGRIYWRTSTDITNDKNMSSGPASNTYFATTLVDSGGRYYFHFKDEDSEVQVLEILFQESRCLISVTNIVSMSWTETQMLAFGTLKEKHLWRVRESLHHVVSPLVLMSVLRFYPPTIIFQILHLE